MYPYHFRPKGYFVDMWKVFVAMPFDDRYQPVYTDLIIPSIDKVNKARQEGDRLTYYRGKDPKHTRAGWLEILEELYTARIVLGVLTGSNPNVFYELGIAHATQQMHRQLLIAEKGYTTEFDLKDLIYTTYSAADPAGSIDSLSGAIEDTLKMYEINQDRMVSLAQSRLSVIELQILWERGAESHFLIRTESPDKELNGYADLCHSRLLSLSTKVCKERIEYSHYWTDLGNALLNRLGIITNATMRERMRNYRKDFPV